MTEENQTLAPHGWWTYRYNCACLADRLIAFMTP